MLFCSSLSQSSDPECHYRYRFSYLASLNRVFIVPKLKCDLSGVPNYGSSYTKTTELYQGTQGPESTRGPLQRAQPSGVGTQVSALTVCRDRKRKVGYRRRPVAAIPLRRSMQD